MAIYGPDKVSLLSGPDMLHIWLLHFWPIYGKSIYATYKDIYIWPISVPYMEFISGLYKNWADITWYNIKAIYGPYKIIYGLIFIWSRYGAYMAICVLYIWPISGTDMGFRPCPYKTLYEQDMDLMWLTMCGKYMVRISAPKLSDSFTVIQHFAQASDIQKLSEHL